MKSLAQYNKEMTIREICDELVGPSIHNPNSWEPEIMGLNKHELLRHLLKVISHNRQLQKLVNHYQELLEQSMSE